MRCGDPYSFLALFDAKVSAIGPNRQVALTCDNQC